VGLLSNIWRPHGVYENDHYNMADKFRENPAVERSRRVLVLVIALALTVLGGTLAWSALKLRERIRAQVAARDGEILDAVAAMQRLDDQARGEALGSLEEPDEQFHLALEVSRLRNVVGVRLFSGQGGFDNSFPAYITESTLPPTDLALLKELRPVSHYSARAHLQEQDLLAAADSSTAPLLVVEVPLHEEGKSRLAGVAQFLMDGSSIARAYGQLDRNLALEFSLAFVVGAAILSLGLGLAVRRVERANRLLAERTGNLLQANRELALAARTSAVGAVASHLIHGLKNPLSGLHNFVHGRGAASGEDGDWQAALDTTRRMQELVNRVVRVLQEQESAVDYGISLSELAGMLEQKVTPLAQAARVPLEVSVAGEECLSNREADLVSLVLENLMQNSIEASPAGAAVRVAMAVNAQTVVFEVQDHGPGIGPDMAARLFAPCTSAKPGGGGIGLAISKQLAQALGAELELAVNGPAGCTFRLVMARKPAGSSAAGFSEAAPAAPHARN
jgi:signal transduction histidine kinase